MGCKDAVFKVMGGLRVMWQLVSATGDMSEEVRGLWLGSADVDQLLKRETASGKKKNKEDDPGICWWRS